MTKQELTEELRRARSRIAELETERGTYERVEERLSLSEQRYRDMIDSMGDAIHVVDADLRIALFNSALGQFAQRLGLDTDVVGKRLPDAFPFLSKQVIDEYRGVFESGETLETEETTTIAGGSFVTWTWKIPVKDGDRVVSIVTVVRDITRRRQTEAELASSSSLLEATVDNTHVLLACMDADFNFIRVNARYAEADEHDPSFYPGKNHFDLFPDDENKDIFQRVLDTGETYTARAKPFEYAEHPERGTSYWDWSLSPIRDSGGAAIGLVLTLDDVSDRVGAADALRQSEARNSAIVAALPDMVFRQRRDGTILDFQIPQGGNLHEHFETLVGRNVSEIDLPPEMTDQNMACIEEAFGTGEAQLFEYRLEFPGGTHSYEARVSPCGDEEVLLIVRDVTERRRAEAALSESEERFRLAFAYAHAAMCLVSPEGVILQVNDGMCGIFGYSREELEGRRMRDISHPDDADISGDLAGRAVANEVTGGQYEKRYYRKDGRLIWAQVSSALVRDPEGNPLQFVSQLHDVTERKLAEDALKESEEKYRLLFETMLNGFAVYDVIYDDRGDPRDYRYAEVNPAYEEYVGAKPGALIGKSILEDFPETMEPGREAYANVASTGVPQRFERSPGHLGKYFTVVAFRPREGQVATLVSDITEHRRMEEELRRYAEAQSVLLREVNHRVKNNLTAIIGILRRDLRRAGAEGTSGYRQLLNELLGSIDGLSTVHSMLTASGWRPLLLSELCERVIRTTLEGISGGKAHSVDVTRSGILVGSDQSHNLAMALNELATNTMKYGSGDAEQMRVKVHIESDIRTVRIVYRDSGAGFPDRVLAETGGSRGTGIDLVRGVVEHSMQGTVTIENDGGAVTTMEFPACDDCQRTR